MTWLRQIPGVREIISGSETLPRTNDLEMGAGVVAVYDTATRRTVMSVSAEVNFGALVAELRAAVGTAGQIRYLKGYTTEGDGGEGAFRWSDTAAADDGGTVLNSGGHGTSAAGWRRIDAAHIVYASWFGANADASASTNYTAIMRAATRANAYGIDLILPKGVVCIDTSLDWRSDGSTNWGGLSVRGYLPLSLPDYGAQQTILEWDGATDDPMIRVSAGAKLQNFTMRVKAGKSTVAAIDHNQHPNIGAPRGGKCVFRELTILGDLYDLASYGDMDYGIVVAREPYRRDTNTVQIGGGPAVTFTGIPDALYDLLVTVTRGGARGTAEFAWSLDAGGSWEETGVVTAATHVLGTTGITANFATGTYELATSYAVACVAVPNLEFSTYDECYVFHQEISSVAILSQSGQAKSHKFNDCQLGEGPIGLELKTGSFVWRGGGMQGAVRGFDVTGSGPSDWCVIYDCNSERCGRLLDRTSGYSSVGAPMMILGGRYSLDDDYLLDGGAGFIKWKIPTPLIVMGTLWENANVADPTIPCIGLEHNTHEPRLVSQGNQYLNANFVRAYADGTYSSLGDCYAPDGVTESTEIACTSNARCDTAGPTSPGETRIDGEASINGGTSYTLSDAFETTDATPHDTTLVAEVPANKHGTYDITVWASGVNQTSGALCLLAKRLVVSVADDGTCTARVNNVDVGDQYDGITVGGLAISHAGTPGVIVATVTGKVGTDILWSLKVDVLTHLVAHELGH